MYKEPFETLNCGQERLVAQLAAQGLAHREIAQKLSVSETTIQEALNTIYAKLRLSSRAQLVLYSVIHGLPSSPVEELRFAKLVTRHSALAGYLGAQPGDCSRLSRQG